MVFKFKIDSKNESGTSFSNRQIHGGLYALLNKACRDAINKFNGRLEWFETFIRFESNGKKYEQIKSENLCEGCVFNKENCVHPFFDTKPYCTGKIYIETNGKL